MGIDRNARLFEINTIDIKTAGSLLSMFAPDENIVEFFRIVTGSSTSNYKVITNNNSSYLLRIYPKDNDHSEMEIASYSYAKTFINMPDISFTDNSGTIIPNTYLFMRFINGVTLREHMLSTTYVNKDIPLRIGKSLALLHNRKYKEMAVLNPDFTVSRPLGSMYETFERFLSGWADKHLGNETKKEICSVIFERKDLLASIDNENVLSHGDFNFSNIIIDTNNIPWIIDFEYCFSAPRYYDIGKFFRKSDEYNKLIIRDSFISGYESVSGRLPNNWWILSKLTEIQTLLALMNREILPEGWANEIEKEIITNLQIVNLKTSF